MHRFVEVNPVTSYQGRCVLITGHTGFKGSWLSTWLLSVGAEVHGIALAPNTEPNLFNALNLEERLNSHLVDVRNRLEIQKAIDTVAPDIVFHLAAQPLVRQSYADPIETFETNVIGTANVLDACLSTGSVKAVVVVTTDKVYENREWPWPYREGDQLGGLDPYSASKACAELVSHVYQRNLSLLKRRDDPVWIATARGGNVVGGGDWSADRIVPDIVRAIVSRAPIVLRNPNAVRPWQHVLELCEGYLELGARLLAREKGADDAWNFGPYPTSTLPVRQLVAAILDVWGLPDYPVEVQASPQHEAQQLRLDISKALHFLQWRPRLDVRQTLSWTAEWYQAFVGQPEKAYDVTIGQIGAFQTLRD